MSGSVWYLSFSRKKIEFKKYPKKKKNSGKQRSKFAGIKGFFFSLLFLTTIIFLAAIASAEPINDTFHINLQTTYANGSIQAGTFAFAFNITDNSSSSCGPNIVYNYSTSLTTDSRGIVSLYLPQAGSGGGNLSQLSYDKQYYLCYFRDGTLKDVTQLSRVPYGFEANSLGGHPASFFMPLNQSVYGNFDFNGGWQNGGFSISGGNIYAQTGYFYNITSLNVTKQNLTINDDLNVFGNTNLRRNLTVSGGALFVDNNTGRVGINTTNTTSATLSVNGTVGVPRVGGAYNWINSNGQVLTGFSYDQFGGAIHSGTSILLDNPAFNAFGCQFSSECRFISNQNSYPLGFNDWLRIGAASERIIYPVNDNTSAIMIGNSTKSAFVDFDTNNSRVGIGTSLPQNKLNVVGDVNITNNSVDQNNVLIVSSGTNAGNSVGQIAIKVTDSSNIAHVGIQGGSYNTIGLWGPGASLTGLPSLAASTGGIFLSVPILEYQTSIRLNPRGDIGSNPGVLITSGGASVPTFAIKGFASQTANLQQWQNNNSGILGVVNATGAFGIGTSTPQNTLNVVGDINVTNSNIKMYMQNGAMVIEG